MKKQKQQQQPPQTFMLPLDVVLLTLLLWQILNTQANECLSDEVYNA